MTTLPEAAQDVVTICKMYRTSLPLDVLSEVKNLEQAIAQEQADSNQQKLDATSLQSHSSGDQSRKRRNHTSGLA